MNAGGPSDELQEVEEELGIAIYCLILCYFLTNHSNIMI